METHHDFGLGATGPRLLARLKHWPDGGNASWFWARCYRSEAISPFKALARRWKRIMILGSVLQVCPARLKHWPDSGKAAIECWEIHSATVRADAWWFLRSLWTLQNRKQYYSCYILILNIHDLNILKKFKFVVIWKCVGLLALLCCYIMFYIFRGIKWSLKWQ